MNAQSEFVLIDDDSINNFVCSSLIREITGADNIKVFNSPKQGIEYIEREYANTEKEGKTLVLLDIYMPLLSGWDVLKIFSSFSEALKNKFKICIVSSTSQELDLAKVLANKYACSFIEKPLTKEKLGDLITYLHAN